MLTLPTSLKATAVAPEQSQPAPHFANWAAWHAYIAQTPTPTTGCFEVKYPNPVWQRTTCAPATSGHAAPSPTFTAASTNSATVGNGNDFVAQSPGTLIGSAVGSFPSATGVTTETDTGVGSNGYSLQENTQGGAPGQGFPVTFNGNPTTGWEQFIFDNEPSGFQGVWIEFWLLGYGSTYHVACSSLPIPAGASGVWFGTSDCYFNTFSTSTPFESPTHLAFLSLGGFANIGGHDEAQLCDAGAVPTCYTNSQPAAFLNLYQHWQLAEFNVLGFIGGSQAQFNSGTSITVLNTIKDQSGNAIAPTSPCPINGQTGETNNLNLGSCSVNGPAGQILFTESLNPPLVATLVGPANGAHTCGPNACSSKVELQVTITSPTSLGSPVQGATVTFVVDGTTKCVTPSSVTGLAVCIFPQALSPATHSWYVTATKTGYTSVTSPTWTYKHP